MGSQLELCIEFPKHIIEFYQWKFGNVFCATEVVQEGGFCLLLMVEPAKKF